MSRHSIKSFSFALFKKPFYVALFNVIRFFEGPLEILIRYVFETGSYPAKFAVRTPLGLQKVSVFSHDDLITFVECFGKLDYVAPKDVSLVVDFGSNIGISALYFLTRNPNVKVYLFEPFSRNVERLKENLKGFETRYEIKECAIGVKEGRADFASEETGRYGGLIEDGPSHLSQCPPERRIEVEVQSANKVLMDILSRQDSIDILKIDVEGFEAEILAHLEMDVLDQIDRIYAEMTTDQKVPGFLSERYGGVTRYYRA
jgi:FkbM family methyltransferase